MWGEGERGAEITEESAGISGVCSEGQGEEGEEAGEDVDAILDTYCGEAGGNGRIKWLKCLESFFVTEATFIFVRSRDTGIAGGRSRSEESFAFFICARIVWSIENLT